jgi:hypothetical protein
MKKANFISSVLGKMVLVFCLFAAVGLSNANAQAKSFKQSDDAVEILRAEANAQNAKLQSYSPASAAFKYTTAKVGVLKTIARSIADGSTTESAIATLFAMPITADWIYSENGLTDKAEVLQVRQEVEDVLQN